MTAQPVDRSSRDLMPGATWRRSSRCDLNGSCVEVTELASGAVGVRDGKIGAASPVLAFSRESWRGFAAGVMAGHFDVG
jgi:hypothetical protein